jgi:hypothetical protein
MAEKYNDYPLEEIASAVPEAIARGATIFQKWTCEACGDRVTGSTPNQLYRFGKHDDCGHITDLSVKGCNYMAIYSSVLPRCSDDE